MCQSLAHLQVDGDIGDVGPRGEDGSQGDPPDPDATVQVNGTRGDDGDAGPTGAKGIKGMKGQKGEMGDEGAPGLKGQKVHTTLHVVALSMTQPCREWKVLQVWMELMVLKETWVLDHVVHRETTSLEKSVTQETLDHLGLLVSMEQREKLDRKVGKQQYFLYA